MKITKAGLREKLAQLDEKLKGLWVYNEGKISDDDIWLLFVELLEARVELLSVCIQAKVPLTKEDAMPEWLERFSKSRQEIRLRELKRLHRKKNNNEKYRMYENISEILGEEEQ